MSYLGRKAARAALVSADIPTNSITTSHIVADTIAAGDIADDAVGTAELANDVAISTSGAITTTGAFTSVGIDDNASGATAMTIDSSERVGIGTGSPAELLHVSKTASENCYIRITADTAYQSGVTFYAAADRKWELTNGSDDTFRLLDGDVSQGVSIAQNATAWSTASDERQKTDWVNFEDALKKINSLTKIGTYKSIDPITKEYLKEDNTLVGVSGQEVEGILPEAIVKLKRHSEKSDDTEYLQLEYQALFVLMLKAVQELSAKNDAFEARISALEGA